jgi:siroheme synthase-like protein
VTALPGGSREGDTETPAGRPGLVGAPVNLLVRGRRVVVVGGGRIAARKVAPLLDAGADVVVVAPSVGAEIRAWADQGRCSVVVRAFEPADLDGAWLAFTATDDPAVNRAVFSAGEQRRIWVNSADDPENCSFTLMSVVRRSDLVIAIGTGGRSPALATYLRRRLGEEIGPEYSTLLDLLSEAREAMRASGRSSEDADWQLAFRSGIVDMVRAGRVEAAKELLRTCLSSSSV